MAIPREWRHRWRAVRGGLGALFFLSALGLAQEASPQRLPTEAEVKGAYLLNFAQYVTWPENAFANDESPVIIGVLGNDPFGGSLERHAKLKQAGRRRIEVKYFKKLQDLQTCHILYVAEDLVSDNETTRGLVENLLAQTRNMPTLVVVDGEGLVKQGFDFGFFIQERRVHFEVNRSAVERRKLKVSSKLLGLRIVRVVDER